MDSVSVIGLGRLGLPLAAVLASRGFEVVGVDNNLKVINDIRDQVILTNEPSLEKLLGETRTRLSVTNSLAAAVDLTNTTFVMVPTPSQSDGRFSLRYVLEVCRGIGKALRDKRDFHLVVINSTVNPGDCERVIRPVLEEESGGKNFGLCYVPEFVALGNIIDGFLSPDFIVIGGKDWKSVYAAAEIYTQLCPGCPIIHTNLVNAELGKIWLNCALITKITLANQIAEMCETIPGADVDEVTLILGADSRICAKYLRGGTMAGGPCFIRDTGSLFASAKPFASGMFGVRLPLIEVVGELNYWQVDRLLNIIARYCKRDTKVGILGLAYKVGVNSMEPSAGLILVERLSPVVTVGAYDPMVQIAESVESAQMCVDRADVIVIPTPWPEFVRVKFHEGQSVIDCWRMLNRDAVTHQGAEYVAIGVGPCE